MESLAVVVGPRAGERLRGRTGFDVVLEAPGAVLVGRSGREADPLVSGFHDDGRRIVATLGPAWIRGKPGVPASTAIAEMLDADGAAAIRDRLFGTAKVAVLSRDGKGLLTGDPWSAATWYRAESGDCVVYGSDAAFTAEVAAIRDKDPFGAGWPIAFGFACGDTTGWRGVRTVAYASEVAIEAGAARDVVVDDTPWRAEASVDDLIEAALDEMRGNVAALATTPRERLLFATGGRDNRLVVALLREAGLVTDTTFVTRGRPADRDVLVAKLLADRLGATHRLDPKPMAGLDDETFLGTIVEHVRRTSGSASPWDVKGEPLEVGRLTITGLWGEPMRSYYARHRFETAAEVAGFLTGNARLDPAGLLNPEAREAYAGVLRDWVSDMEARGEPAEDMTDAFYMPHRLRRWLGVRMERNPELRAHPLMSVQGCRAAYAGGFPLRRRDGVHFALLLRIAPDLLEIPLAGARFDEANAVAHGLDPATIPPAIEDADPAGTENWQDAEYPRLRKLLADVVYADRSNPVFDLVDRAALARLLRREMPASRTVRQRLVAVLGAGLWLGESATDA